MSFYGGYRQVQEKKPIVQCITNIVTVNDCANILLACGASPIMAEDIREMQEMVSGVSALVCNMGAISFGDSMVVAGMQANKCGVPVVLDPVAAGATRLRRDVASQLLKHVHLAAIRGNASEIKALAGQGTQASSVDVAVGDEVSEENLADVKKFVRDLANKLNTVVALSGVIDVISDGKRTAAVRNGCATMARITGSGCMLTSLVGAFIGAAPTRPFDAAVAAMTAMGVCGELAEEKRVAEGTGTASFRTYMIDAMSLLTKEQLDARAQVEVDA